MIEILDQHDEKIAQVCSIKDIHRIYFLMMLSITTTNLTWQKKHTSPQTEDKWHVPN